MKPVDERHRDELAFARYLARVSLATRIVGILSTIGAVLTILFTLVEVRSSSDRAGFTLIGLALALFGVLVWGTGAFHGAFGRAVPTLVAIDQKLEALAANAARAEGAAVAPYPPPPAAAAKSATAASSRSAPSAEAMAPPPALRSDRPPEAAAPRAAPSPAPARPPQAEPAASEPEREPCPHCGGRIHPQATRCLHCMKKIPR